MLHGRKTKQTVQHVPVLMALCAHMTVRKLVIPDCGSRATMPLPQTGPASPSHRVWTATSRTDITGGAPQPPPRLQQTNFLCLIPIPHICVSTSAERS